MQAGLKVSVITPSYNQGVFLEACIRSVIEQNYANIQHIVMDGGSTDGSVDVLKKHSRHLAYWVSEPDQGQAFALNEGLRHATGDIIGWLNSDDLCAPGAIRRVTAFFSKHPDAIMVYGDCNVIDGNGRTLSSIRPGAFSMDGLLWRNPIMQPAAFFRKTLIDQLGDFDTRFKYAIDHDMWLRASVVFEEKIEYLPQVLACYRVHERAQSWKDAVPALLDEIAVRKKFAARKDLPAHISARVGRIFCEPFEHLLIIAADADNQPALFSYLRSELGDDILSREDWHALGQLLAGSADHGIEWSRGTRALTELKGSWLRHHRSAAAEMNLQGSAWVADLLIKLGHHHFFNGHTKRAVRLGRLAIKQDPATLSKWPAIKLFLKGFLGQSIVQGLRRSRSTNHWRF